MVQPPRGPPLLNQSADRTRIVLVLRTDLFDCHTTTKLQIIRLVDNPLTSPTQFSTNDVTTSNRFAIQNGCRRYHLGCLVQPIRPILG